MILGGQPSHNWVAVRVSVMTGSPWDMSSHSHDGQGCVATWGGHKAKEGEIRDTVSQSPDHRGPLLEVRAAPLPLLSLANPARSVADPGLQLAKCLNCRVQARRAESTPKTDKAEQSWLCFGRICP